MESSIASSFAKTGQALADKAVRKVQDGMDTANDAGAAVAKTSDRVQSAAKRGLNTLADMATDARDFASDASDSILSFTKENPMKSLAIAAASGALIYAAFKAVRFSRR
jgi:ElaB/YqjD/DUF883 family membrane-anchored ribosome-binding protein